MLLAFELSMRQCLHARAIQRVAVAGMAIVTQPIFLFAEIESYYNNLGPERTKQTYPIQTMLQAGIKVALSSDSPATAWADPANPFIGIKSAVNRLSYNHADTGQEQRIDVSTAIMLYTKHRPGNHTDSLHWTACGWLSC